ncbi:MAG: amidohydrolase family protein [Promethearchaeota archaeon]|nr:MAG: amidohydrolase family protein [Candidatus Lokiarchaeota archaeon]
MSTPEDFKIFDSHIHTYGVFLAPHKDVISYMDHYHVEKAIITTINRVKYHSKQKEYASHTESQIDFNKYLDEIQNLIPKGQLSHQDVIDIASKAPDRFYKFFWFNPKLNPEEEEENYIILEDHFEKGFIGVKIHGSFNFFKFPKGIYKLATFIQDFNKDIILFIHSHPKTKFHDGTEPQDIAKLAKKFPDLRIIVGHGGFCMEFAMQVGLLLKKFENLYFETSCSPSLGIYNLIKTVGHKRIIFGSDSPTTSTLPIEIEKIISLPRISNEVKQDIFYNNVLNLLKL